jgi:hypothetical protein
LLFPVSKIFDSVPKLESNNSNNLLYSGGSGIAHNIETFLEWSNINELMGVNFTVSVSNSALKQISSYKNVHKKIMLPWDRLPFLYNKCSAGYVSTPKGWGGDSLPSKVFSLMASSRALVVVSDKDSELYRLVVKNNLGIALTHDEATLVSGIKKIKKFMGDNKMLYLCGNNGRRYVEQFHDNGNIASEIISSFYDD